MKVWTFIAREDGGMEFSPLVKMRLFQHLKAHAGRRYAVVFEETQRSGQQNRFFHFYLHLVAEETGNSETLLKEQWIKDHAPFVEDTWQGQTIMRKKRTHEMTKASQ